MEGDFEVWLRSSLFHEEIEASVFEQRSLEKIEAFWVNWREKVTSLPFPRPSLHLVSGYSNLYSNTYPLIVTLRRSE